MSDTRDLRIDLIRGAALLMIFVDHIPRNVLGFVTLHDFGFCDAAEVFVLLAGVSSMLAYGRAFERDGVWPALRRIAQRCLHIYAYQVGLFLLTVAVVYLWTHQQHTAPTRLAPLFQAPATGLGYALTLRALPEYLDILPLYIVLLASFPLVYLALRRSPFLALGLSALVWMFANLHQSFDFPNWIDGKGWYFDPFAWQFLFTIGAVLLTAITANRDRLLPYHPWLAALCATYLAVAFLEAAPWKDWGLPNLQLFPLEAPDKSLLAWPRILDILALIYLLFSAERVQEISRHKMLRPIVACGRHSLEVFSASCVLALFSRLAFRTFDSGLVMQMVVNVIGIGAMCSLGVWLEMRRETAQAAPVAVSVPA